MRDFTHKILQTFFTNFMRIDRQVSMLIQSLSSLGDRASADQFLVIVKLTQQKSKAISIWWIILHLGNFKIQGRTSRHLSLYLPQEFVYHL